MNYFNENSTKKFHNANDDNKRAIRKFVYELKLRKKEFVNECAKYDFDFSSRIKNTHFRAILEKFTCFLSISEKDCIFSNFVINDTYVNYLEVSNLNCVEDYIFNDPLLNHLNILKQKYDLRNISLNINSISKVVEVHPLDLLNFQISEENFMIHLAKQIMEYILENSKKLSHEEFIMQLLAENDFNIDGYYTIGELNNFLSHIKLSLEEYDLRFFFESIGSDEGKFPIEKLKDFIIIESKKNFGVLINTTFMHNKNEIFSEENLKEESRIEKIMSSNYLLQIIKESLKNCGKSFLLKYFSNYIVIIENNICIDSVWLEVGYKKLGYREISGEDIGIFKYFCVKKSFASLNNNMTLNVKLEILFDFLIKECNITEGKNICESNTIIKEISAKILNDLTENILSYGIDKNVKDKYAYHVDEYEIRRKIMSSFKFIDHDYMEYIIQMLKIKNDQVTEKNLENKTFNIEFVETRQWLHLMLNFLFMGLIKHSDELGLILDDYDKVHLNGIYSNLEKKIFPKDNLVGKPLRIPNIDTNNHVVIEDQKYSMKEKLDFEKIKIQENIKIIKNFAKDKKLESNNYLDDNLKDEINNSKNSKINFLNLKSNQTNTMVNEKFEKNNNVIFKHNNQIQSKSQINNLNVNVCDTVNFVPELFELCARHIREKFKLETITCILINKIGCCQIFRDHFKMNKIDLRNEINFQLFLMNLKTTPYLTDSLFKFLEFLALKYQNKNELINPLYFFSKIEEIMIQYTRLNLPI